MKLNIKYKFILACISVVSFCSCGNNNYNDFKEVTTPVKVKEVSLSSLQQKISTTGTAIASKSIEIASETAGEYYLNVNPKKRRKFQLGDHVKKGTIIIELINREYTNGIQFESKQLALEIAENEWKSQKRLFEKGGVTLKDVNNSRNSFINAKSNLENASINLNKLKIIAPFDGIIVSLPYHTESNKIPSGEKVVQIMEYNKMYMEVKLSEKNINNVNIGDNIEITNYTLKNDTLNGKLTQLSPAVNPETRTFNGYLEIDNPERKLRPGMFIKADIIVKSLKNIIVIPKEIIKDSPRGKVVYIVQRNRAIETPIKIGLETETEVEVLNGLEKNQRLIISGYEMLNEHSKVKITK